MTEDEAKKTICPVLSGPISTPDDRGNYIVWEPCIASQCMWWIECEWIKTRIKGQDGHFINEPTGHCGAINK